MHLFRKHEWSEWKETGPCEEKRKCTLPNCTHVENRTTHSLSEWKYVDERSCVKERHCMKSNCDFSELKEIPHVFSEWSYYQANCCTQRRICERCGFAEYREKCPEELAAYPMDNECKVVYKCPRCSDETIQSIPHRWKTDIKTYYTCLSYRKKVNESKVENLNQVLRLRQSHTKQTNQIPMQLVEIQKLQRRIAHDEALLQDNSLKNQNAAICEKCLFIKRFADRTQKAKRKESIFISYCHNVDAECICNLGAQLEKLGYLIVIDRLVRPFDDFSVFMETIRNNDYVICVINDDYLRSFSCMTEITAFMQEQNYRERLLPINAENDCFNWEAGAAYKAYWKLAQEKNIDNIEAKYNKCVDINLKISEFLTFVQAINSPSIYNMSQTVQWISEKLLNDARGNQ